MLPPQRVLSFPHHQCPRSISDYATFVADTISSNICTYIWLPHPDCPLGNCATPHFHPKDPEYLLSQSQLQAQRSTIDTRLVCQLKTCGCLKRSARAWEMVFVTLKHKEERYKQYRTGNEKECRRIDHSRIESTAKNFGQKGTGGPNMQGVGRTAGLSHEMGWDVCSTSEDMIRYAELIDSGSRQMG